MQIGKGCKISNKISCYNVNGSLGDNVRIDDYVCLKGRILLKSNIHIARGCTLSGGTKGIFIDNYTNLSNYVQIFSMSDDYFMPFIPGGALSNVNRKKFARKKTCWFAAKSIKADWKDPKTYGWLVNEFGKISPARVTSISRKHQRFANNAVKRARNIGLISQLSDQTAH